MEVVDPRTDHLDLEPTSTVEILQTILPYFPDDERMARYLCYISSGWTRKQALIRAGATSLTLEEWRKDPEFYKLDCMPYNELKQQVANAYLEREVRKNTIMWVEFDAELLQEAQRKMANDEELTRDERAILLKRASTYSPETLGVVNKLVNGQDTTDDDHSGMVVDMLALVLRRNGR